MYTSLFILLFSAGALAYWLRLTVVTILNRERVAAEAERLAQANRLEFPQIRRKLQESGAWAEDGRLAEALRHDFLALTYLLRYAATINVGRYSKEEKLLVADFYMMRAVYALGRRISPRLARYSMLEMTEVLEHFAGIMSHRMSNFAVDMITA
jgi:hypothetical protein